jgi:hypothetical protein
MFCSPHMGLTHECVRLVSVTVEAANTGKWISSAGQLAQDGMPKADDVRLRPQIRGRCALLAATASMRGGHQAELAGVLDRRACLAQSWRGFSHGEAGLA